MTDEVIFTLSIEPDGKEDMTIKFSIAVDAGVVKRAEPQDLWESVARLLTRHAVIGIESMRQPQRV